MRRGLARMLAGALLCGGACGGQRADGGSVGAVEGPNGGGGNGSARAPAQGGGGGAAASAAPNTAVPSGAGSSSGGDFAGTAGTESSSGGGYAGYAAADSSSSGGAAGNAGNPADSSALSGSIWDGGTPVIGGACGAQAEASASATSCGCTRRPGSGNSWQCPEGIGEMVTSSVGPGGGTISIEGRQGPASGVAAAIDIPPNAIAEPTDITLIETAIPPPHDFLDWSPVYRVEPLGFALATPAPIRLPWQNLSGTVPTLGIWYSPDGSCFSRLTDSYTNAGFEQASISRFGYFLVAAQRSAPTDSCP